MKLSLSVRIAESYSDKKKSVLNLEKICENAKLSNYQGICMRPSQIGIENSKEEILKAYQIVTSNNLTVSMVTGDFDIPANNELAGIAQRNITPYIDLCKLLNSKLIRIAIISQVYIKIKLIFNTYELLFSDPIITLFGVGGGNYSSRAAFMVSGEYLSYQPSFIPVTPSKFMLEYILTIWDRATYTTMIGGTSGNSMVNEPFLEYCSIAGEAGLIGFILLIIVLLELVIFGLRFNNLLLLLGGIYISLILFTNNWFSFPSFALMMWLVIKFAISNKQVKNAKI